MTILLFSILVLLCNYSYSFLNNNNHKIINKSNTKLNGIFDGIGGSGIDVSGLKVNLIKYLRI